MNEISNIIQDKINELQFCKQTFTSHHKILSLQAFNNLLNKFPTEMTDYLKNDSRSGGFQAKLFQEYISLLENSLPFSISKNKKPYIIKTLLDQNLSLFDGISIFKSEISDKLEIKNNTKEFYVGGRKGSLAKPYYIGKLLNIMDSKNNTLLINVLEYNFSKIKLYNVLPKTEVTVVHLRIPPHYQMGGMVYINRARKQIIENIKK